MRIVLFYHSLVSDWNHGNAHFLRGVTSELLARGHDVLVCEPANGWSLSSLVADQGTCATAGFHAAYPHLRSRFYSLDSIDLDEVLDGAQLVIVHEWSDPGLVARLGEHRLRSRAYRLFFHDTHHRSVTDPAVMGALDLSAYDGVLAYGEAVRQQYLKYSWAEPVWVWHEAADTRVFYPRSGEPHEGDLVWIGNWGDDERNAELHEFLLEPAATLKLRARVHGVRYPPEALEALARAGCAYAGWLANYRVPHVFGRFGVTVHVPRRAYVRDLPGIPTIRPFEALACGIPLVSSPWSDSEGLFRVGRDFLVARTGRQMTRMLKAVLHDREMAQEMARSGLATIRARHTCAHRVDELLACYRTAGGRVSDTNLRYELPAQGVGLGRSSGSVVPQELP